jgi:hypothetical protein
VRVPVVHARDARSCGGDVRRRPYVYTHRPRYAHQACPAPRGPGVKEHPCSSCPPGECAKAIERAREAAIPDCSTCGARFGQKHDTQAHE